MKPYGLFIQYLSIVFCSVLISSCDFNQINLHHSQEYKVFPDAVKQGDFYAKALSATHLISNYPTDSTKTKNDTLHWHLTKDISHYPKFDSHFQILNALYNMSLEELEMNINQDSLFDTGEKWKGVWTRDISYSVILALAITNPEISKKSLLHKVKNGRIIQDTGTGGSWPISSDRMIWSTAAWEIYLSTGDKQWLKKAYSIIKKSTETDLNVVWDYNEHLFKGESSFLDWREQSYPKWMDAKDIYSAFSLSTQAVHYQNLIILSKMGKILNHDTQKYQHISKALKKSINEKFWIKDKKVYAQFKYNSRSPLLSNRTENLGQSLCILFDIADDEQKKQIIMNTVQLPYGVPCFYPQIPNISPYHNNSIWPFVQAYWNWASTKTKNDESVKQGLASLIRSSALFLTNKENMVAETGDFKGTAINSNRQLWSVAGSLSSIYRVLFGLNFKEDHLQISPFIPRDFKGEMNITNLKYRNSTLDIKVLGFGNQINSFMIDSFPLNENEVSGLLKGHHKIVIEMTNNMSYRSKIKLKQNAFSPEIPQVKLIDSSLVWQHHEDERKYRIFCNGKLIHETRDTVFQLPESKINCEYQLESVDKNKYQSFLSEPVYINPKEKFQIIEAEWFSNQKNPYIELNPKKNPNFIFKLKVKESGTYYIDFRYANGNGSLTSNNQCATRSLWVSHDYLGTVVFPQRGEDDWKNWGFSNTLKINLKKGSNDLNLKLERFNENQNIKNTAALIDQIRIRKID
ncbi:glycogen debranching protein [Ancylomarina euxinus]|uniref:Glycogen debranching protein n=1 Tax=Ancylomarina euxinus TaxID=2283627 RepID=A0A425XY60_9BACT|nr:amylo-alpha-1,6-glucosidase [Ancylomarina euxinus]MCZ4695935.1 family 78 glycoside hydrolase catalytic domain [Ancylomarina euxinus]MUP16307.1 Bacterial alpha-L-rhamnosidase [Ancylomarina euxinus]RRG19704.1 glycogen debranching protein [Ancylomarina euxinus]